MKRSIASVAFLLATTSAATADPGETPLSLSLGGGVAVNNDDMADDFDGSHAMTSLAVGYRFRTHTEPFVTGGIGLGGHEAMFTTFGAGVRQHLALGAVEPHAQVGVYHVGDEAELGPTLGIGGGAQVRLANRFFAGADLDYYFSRDSDEVGGLEWTLRLSLGARL
ncbi:MAG TPA: hypothetical protein VIV11_36630 [Kofleriaceae bacterium]